MIWLQEQSSVQALLDTVKTVQEYFSVVIPLGYVLRSQLNQVQNAAEVWG